MAYDPDTAAIIKERLEITQKLNTARISSLTRAQLRLELVTLVNLFRSRRLTISATTAALAKLHEKVDAAITGC